MVLQHCVFEIGEPATVVVQPVEQFGPGFTIFLRIPLMQFMDAEPLFGSTDLVLGIADACNDGNIEFVEKAFQFFNGTGADACAVCDNRQAGVVDACLADQ